MDQSFAKRILTLRGSVGQRWLDELPKLIQLYESKWHIKCLTPFSLSYNYVVPAETSDGRAVVLKISFPDNHEFLSEVEALKFYEGQGSIQIIEDDSKNNTVLLERAIPGTRIGNVSPDEKQISLVSEVIKKIHKPIAHKDKDIFPTLVDWGKVFARYRQNFSIQSGPVPTRMFEEAEDIFLQYTQDKHEKVLLHGDLHNDNILSSERGWLVIDPKGVIGDRAFEVGTYLRNPLADLAENSNYKLIEKNRISQFSEELGLDKVRILNWTFANTIISVLWFLEDEKRVSDIYLKNAELIKEITL